MTSVHASAILIGEGALLVRGTSGSGKTSLALDLLRQSRDIPNYFVRLIADDRILLETWNGYLLASVPAPLAGLIETRWQGIESCAFEKSACVCAVLDLDPAAQRFPENHETVCDIEGVQMRRFCRLPHTRLHLSEAYAMISSSKI